MIFASSVLACMCKNMDRFLLETAGSEAQRVKANCFLYGPRILSLLYSNTNGRPCMFSVGVLNRFVAIRPAGHQNATNTVLRNIIGTISLRFIIEIVVASE